MDMAKFLILYTVLAACLALTATQWNPGTSRYGNLYTAGYGINNAALSQTLFKDGVSCGQCYLVICDGSRPRGQYCKPGTAITVTATHLCPANYALPNSGWCGPGRPHFDMSQPAWERIGVYQAGIIPVL
ncbi:expansin-A31-like [Panicum miliaceum]|uniref:Expansin n=1 Tax=Panicum miliaceum TaxID=4540 RepID=A0A3L6SAC0_PANMI|nr:expansin-A31-like [Panicum miliaceum]